MGRWVIALIACAAGFAVLQARAQVAEVVLAPSIFATRALPSDSTTTFSVTCPPGHLAVSAGVSTPGSGTTLLSIRPAGSRAYAFRFGNPGTNPARHVTVVVACREIRISIKAQAPVIKLMQVKTRPIVVPPGVQRAASLACPGRTAPAGAGADLAAADLSVRRVSASLHGFSFRAWNYGSKSATAVFYGNCVTVVRPAGAERARLHVTLTTFSGPVHPGRQKITHSCPRGWFSLATGYTLPAARLQIEGSAPRGGGGRWGVFNNAADTTLVDLQLACGQLRSS
jgi:hypothetical protein